MPRAREPVASSRAEMERAGMVMRRRRGEGFALRFKRLNALEQALLERAVKYLRLHMLGK